MIIVMETRCFLSAKNMPEINVKELIIKRIDSKHANDFIRKWHYSGKIVMNSQLHFGVFYEGKLHGVMSFGASLDKRKIMALVPGTKWNEFVELNRMAFDDLLPKNSESRCLSVAIRLIKKHAPHIKWIISFADATQCGDGTMYRASGFVLTAINVSKNLCKRSDGVVIHKMTLESNPTTPRRELGGKSYYDITGGKYNFKKYIEQVGGELLNGYQLRYIYFMDKKYMQNLTVSILPYSRIKEIDAGMYRGVRKEADTVSSHQYT